MANNTDNTDNTDNTEDYGLVSLEDLLSIKLTHSAGSQRDIQQKQQPSNKPIVFRLKPKTQSAKLLESSDTAVLDWLVAQLEEDLANSQDEQYIRYLKKDFLSLKEDVAQTVFSQLIDSVTDVLPTIKQETVQIEDGQEIPLLYQPTKISMSLDGIIRMKEKHKDLSKQLNIKLEEFNHLQKQLIEEDYKHLDQLISILEIIFSLTQLDENGKINKLNEMPKDIKDQVTRVAQKLFKKDYELKDSKSLFNIPTNKALDRLTEFETLKEFLTKIKTLDLTSEPKLKQTLNSGVIYLNVVKLQVLDEEATKDLFNEITALKENIRSIVNLKKQIESLKKFIEVVELIQDKARFQKTLQDKEKEYQQLSKEKIYDKIDQLQTLLQDFFDENLQTFRRLISTFDAMLTRLNAQHPQYQIVENTKKNYELIYEFLNIMLKSTDNLQDLKDLLLDYSSIRNNFNDAELKVLNTTEEYTELFEKLVPIKQLIQEICSPQDEASLSAFRNEIEELRQLRNYQIVTSTSEALHTESESETVQQTPKESKVLSLSEIITQLDTLETHYDKQQYTVLTHNVETFLSKLQYTIEIVSNNFSTNVELMTTLPNILSKVQAIQAKLAAMHSKEPLLLKKYQ